MHGHGQFDYIDGDYYIGQFENDLKHGQGTFTWADNDVYTGEWKNDPDALNEFYRQMPRTESHAFRDESKQSLYSLSKIYFILIPPNIS